MILLHTTTANTDKSSMFTEFVKGKSHWASSKYDLPIILVQLLSG